MDQNPNHNECEVCHQAFGSEQELQAHRQSAHGENRPTDRQGNYDIERDEQKRDKKIA
jgi:hypothetical protein